MRHQPVLTPLDFFIVYRVCACWVNKQGGKKETERERKRRVKGKEKSEERESEREGKGGRKEGDGWG